MTCNSKFNFDTAVALAQGGDAAQWEAIARHLLAKQPKAKKPRKAQGPQTWAHVTLEDGREFLTSKYAKGDAAATIKAHGEYAQHRARMEDSGDRSDPLGAFQRAFLNPAIKSVPVRSATIVTGEAVEAIRDRCFIQRAFRQGWYPAWLKDNPPAIVEPQQVAA